MSTLRRSVTSGLVIALAATAVGFVPIWRQLEVRAQGVLVSLRGPRAWNPDVVIVEVDEATTRELGWPLRRDTYAQVVNALAVAGAKVAAFELLFVDPAVDPHDDFLFAGAARTWGKVVLSVECLGRASDGDLLPASMPVAGPTAAHVCPSLSLPAPGLVQSVALGHVAPAPRGVVAWLEAGRRRVPALAIAALTRADGLTAAELIQAPRSISIGPRTFELTADGALIPTFRGFPSSARVSLRWVVSELQRAPPELVPASLIEAFKGKHVLIGKTAMNELLAPVAIHATLLSDLLEGETMHEAGPWVPAASVAVLVLLLTALAIRFRPALAIALAAVGLAGFAGLAVWLVGERWLISPAAPMLAGLCAFAAALAVQQRDRRQLRRAFAGSVAPRVLARLFRDPRPTLALDGAKKTVTVLVCHIKGYAGVDDALPAAEVLTVLRAYVTAVAQVVKKHEGRIDRISGEAIHAVFGDPLADDEHALRAVTAGVQLLEEETRLQQLWSGQGKKGIAIRIGVATGEVFVGDLGPAGTVAYTVLGPAVTLAARLEGKAPAGAMLVSEATYQACRARHRFHPVGGLELKGFTDPVQGWLFVGSGLEADPERHAPRLPTQAPATVRLGGATVQGVVENVSAGGLYVIAEGAVAAGDVIELEFAPSTHLAAAVTVRAEVRHVARRDDGLQGFGVRIERADAQRGEDLRHFVALYLGPQPDGEKVGSGGDTFRLELGEAYGRLIKEEPR